MLFNQMSPPIRPVVWGKQGFPLIFHSLLINDQRDAQIPFYVFIFIFNSLHVSSTSCSSSGETNCVNTTSGNCHSVLVADTATDIEWQLPEIAFTQFVSPDDEHDVLETCSELKIKINTFKGICVWRWSFTKNHYMMHCQQNVKFLIHCSPTYSVQYSSETADKPFYLENNACLQISLHHLCESSIFC
jgi:hypothetical protein